MFHYPRKAEVAHVLPKNKLYARARAGRALQRKFVEQVAKIVWRYKLAPESINLPPGDSVKEIQVFDLHLKAPDLHEDVLRAIDRTIRHPIAFRLYHGDRLRCAIAQKRPHASDPQKWVVGDYFGTEWTASDAQAPAPLPTALDLRSLYEQVLAAHLPLPAREGESLAERIDRLARIRQAQREADRIETRIHKEKQFNRKVELNRELQALKKEIEAFSTP